MKQAILDTNFILSCVKQKIDFFNETKFLGLEIVIPREVVEEITKIKETGKKLHSRKTAELSLKILEQNEFKKIKLNKKSVDKGLVNLSKKSKDIIIATLDKELKRKIKGQKLVIKGRKKLEII